MLNVNKEREARGRKAGGRERRWEGDEEGKKEEGKDNRVEAKEVKDK